ncbi:MAG: glycosyltransferase family 2 protein [Erythrobacter sp.]
MTTLIICPTFDHADTLLMATASVRAQTRKDWQMVVICDGSPDRTREVMEAICRQDNRISYVWKPKGERYGETYRDAVIRQVDSAYVCHLGDDDLWLPNHLECL